MNSKTDKEAIGCCDITFLSEITADFRFWQAIFDRNLNYFDSDSDDITTFWRSVIVSIY
jgi:hypothetical protein